MESQYRQDVLTGHWVIISSARAKRPEAFIVKKVEKEKHKKCAFCEGHELETPPEKYAVRNKGTRENEKGWRIRVIDNKYQVFDTKKNNERKSTKLFPYQQAIGIHEVIITKNPAKDIGEFTRHQVKELIETFIQRISVHKNNPEIKHIQIIQNHGKRAGSSMTHPHSQLFGGGNYKGTWLDKELKHSKRHFAKEGRCLFCDILEKEIKSGKRIIYKNRNFIAYSPYASSYPFQISVAPRFHSAFFEEMNEKQIKDFAEIVQFAFHRLYVKLRNPDYNFFIRLAPVKFRNDKEEKEIRESFHWHLEILPKVTTWGGYEYATNVVVNVVLPEESAEFFRL